MWTARRREEDFLVGKNVQEIVISSNDGES